MLPTHTIYFDARDIPNALATLRAMPPPADGMLSVVLDTSVTRIPGRAFLLFFRDAARDVRAALEPAGAPEVKAFDTAVEEIDSYLLHRLAPRHPGLALFVSIEPDFFMAVPLPTRPTQQIVWDRRPQLAPLIQILDEYERVAVALLDKRQTRIFTVYLGSIELWDAWESDLAGKHAAGDWPRRTRSTRVREGRDTPGTGGTIAWSGMGQARQRRRHEEHVTQHVRETAGSLMELLRERPFDRLILAGPEEATVRLRDNLPRPLQARYATSLPLPIAAGEADVLTETLRAAEVLEREAEVASVRRLIDTAGSAGAAIGLEATLEALNDGRVDQLVITDTFDHVVLACTECGWLTVAAEACPTCGSPVERAGDPRERIIAETLDQSGRIETVSGTAAQLLEEHGGLGAFTRY